VNSIVQREATHPPAKVGAVGIPVRLRLRLIDEDPAQPRAAHNPGFSPASVAELAESIRRRGVKTPISVRPNPDRPGRFLINHGARRFRASHLAGCDTIPAFLDEDYNQADQVVENLHRDGLTAREIADYIGRELARGLRKADIARQISKSAAFVTQHAVLLDLPDPLAAAFSTGRVRDVTLVNELLKAFKASPTAVADWLADAGQEITRGTVQMLRAFLVEKSGGGDAMADHPGADLRPPADSQRACPAGRAHSAPAGRVVLRVSHGGRAAQLLLRRRPSIEGWAWLCYEDDAGAAEVPLSELVLLALIEI